MRLIRILLLLLITTNYLLASNHSVNDYAKLNCITCKDSSIVAPNIYYDSINYKLFYIKGSPLNINFCQIYCYDIIKKQEVILRDFNISEHKIKFITSINDSIIFYYDSGILKYKMGAMSLKTYQYSLNKDFIKQFNFTKETFKIYENKKKEFVYLDYNYPYLNFFKDDSTYTNIKIEENYKLVNYDYNNYSDIIYMALIDKIDKKIIVKSFNLNNNKYEKTQIDIGLEREKEIANTGMKMLDQNKIIFWYSINDSVSKLFTINLLNNNIEKKYTIKGVINDVFNKDKQSLLMTITYSTGNFYKINISNDPEIKAYFNSDFYCNIYEFNLLSPDSLIQSAINLKPDLIIVNELSFNKLKGKGNKIIEIPCSGLKEDDYILEINFNSFKIKDSISVLIIENNIETVVYESSNEIRGIKNIKVPISFHSNSRIIFRISSEKKNKSDWEFDYTFRENW